MDNLERDAGLTADEEAFFASGGETEVKDAPSDGAQQDGQQEQLSADQQQEEQQQVRDDKGRFVPHQALHAEREEHKKTRAELIEIRQRQAILDDRWKTMLAAEQQGEKQKVEDDPMPDQNQDIFAFTAWQQRQMQRLQEKVTAREQQEEQAQQIAQTENAVWSEWHRSSAEFAERKPDFADARTYLAELRDKQLTGLSRVHPQFASKQGRDQQINQELAAIIVAAKQQNISPAEAVYEMAASWGYAPKGEEQNKTLELPDKLKGIASAQEASRTVAQASGRGAGAADITPEAIANMSEADFQKWHAVPENAKRFSQMMGG